MNINNLKTQQNHCLRTVKVDISQYHHTYVQSTLKKYCDYNFQNANCYDIKIKNLYLF